MMMMVVKIVLCPKAGSLAFTPPWDEMNEVVSRCLPHRQLWVSNLSKVATVIQTCDPPVTKHRYYNFKYYNIIRQGSKQNRPA